MEFVEIGEAEKRLRSRPIKRRRIHQLLLPARISWAAWPRQLHRWSALRDSLQVPGTAAVSGSPKNLLKGEALSSANNKATASTFFPERKKAEKSGKEEAED